MLLRAPSNIRGTPPCASPIPATVIGRPEAGPELGLAPRETSLDGASRQPAAPKTCSRADKICELAVLVCLLAGAVGIMLAPTMCQVDDVLLCLAGSIGACTLVCYLYFQQE
jgi:hypothetical protein